MRLRTLLFMSCGFASLISGSLTAIASRSDSPTLQTIALGSALLLVLALAWFYSKRYVVGLRKIERVLAGDDSALVASSGLFELDQLAISLHQSARQWEAIASDSRRQVQEFGEMIQMLDRRILESRPDSSQLKTILTSLGAELQSELQQCDQILHETRQQISHSLHQSESHSSALNRANSLIQQMMNSLHTIDAELKARSENASESKRLAQLQEMFATLKVDLQEIQTETGRCEKKLSSLSDPAKELTGTIQNIADLAARTDLLALNASIESIRAGEHGKGFAIVADEVRKMAEQIADSTRELSTALDAMQLVITESNRSVFKTHEKIVAQVSCSKSIQDHLLETAAMSRQDYARLLSVSETTDDSRNLLDDVRCLFEQASEAAQFYRNCNESALQAAGSASNRLGQATSLAHRLSGGKQATAAGGKQATVGATKPAVVDVGMSASPVLTTQS